LHAPVIYRLTNHTVCDVADWKRVQKDMKKRMKRR